jgi:hypothetical protein
MDGVAFRAGLVERESRLSHSGALGNPEDELRAREVVCERLAQRVDAGCADGIFAVAGEHQSLRDASVAVEQQVRQVQECVPTVQNVGDGNPPGQRRVGVSQVRAVRKAADVRTARDAEADLSRERRVRGPRHKV